MADPEEWLTKLTEDQEWLAQQKPNLPTLEHLYSTPAHELARLSVEELCILQVSLKEEQARVKRMTDNFHGAVTEKLQGRFSQAYSDLNKDTGRVIITDGDIVVTCEMRKDVKWDQGLLTELWGAFLDEGKQPSDYIKAELSVPEAVYNKLSPATKAKFLPARTTKPGKPTYLFADKRLST